MNSFELLKWAVDLRDIDPIEKLVAIYFAMRAGSNEGGIAELAIDIVELGNWCGCKKEEAYHVVLQMEKVGWEIVEIEPYKTFHIAFEFSSQEEPVQKFPPIGPPLTLYVITNDQAVKIGITGNLTSRLSQLTSSSPFKVRVCLKASGPRAAIFYVEQGCHAELLRHRIHGEWFSCSVDAAKQVAREWLRKVGIKPDES